MRGHGESPHRSLMTLPPLDAYTADTLEREPALALAMRFAAPDERTPLLGTAVLMRELLQIAIGSSDGRVAEAKLGWWHEEAQRWATGAPRHPLAQAFDAIEVAPTLGVLIGEVSRWLDGSSSANAAALSDRLAPAANALADMARSSGVAWRHLLLAGALRQPVGEALLFNILPLDLIARHGVRRGDTSSRQKAMVDFANAISAWPTPSVASRGTRALLSFERGYLTQRAAGVADENIRLRRRDVLRAWWSAVGTVSR